MERTIRTLTANCPNSTEQYMSTHAYSDLLWAQQQKQKQQHYTQTDKKGAYIRTILTKLGHPQLGPTPIQTDSTVAAGIANDTVKTKRTKPWTCDSIGYEIAYAKANSEYTGRKAHPIRQTTSPNITHHPTTRNNTPHTYRSQPRLPSKLAPALQPHPWVRVY